MINVKEKKTERTEKIGKGKTAPKRKKTATVERIAQAIGSKRFLAIVLCCCAWAVFHAVNMYAVYSDLLKRVRDALPIYSGEEMQRFAELTSDLIYTFRVTAGIYCILECILPIAAAAAFAAVHCDARRGQLAEGSGIPLLRMTLAVQVVIGIAAAVTLCLLVVCAAELEQDIIVFRKTVLNIIATPPPVFTPMRIAAIIITAGGINAALCTLECFLFRMFGNVRSQLSAEPNGGRAEIRLQRAEYLKDLDLYGLLHYLENDLIPAMDAYHYHVAVNPVDLMLGLTGCHSSFLPMFRKVAQEEGVSLLCLIADVSAIDRKAPSENLLRDVAKKLK